MSHFTVSERYLYPDERFDKADPRKEAYLNARQRRRDQAARLKELGFKQPYFQYRNNDAEAKAEAKAKAEAFAKDWSAKAGFELEVAEGCFL